MNLLAAATPAQSAPVYQNQAYQNQAYQNQNYQNTTTQSGKPAPKSSWVAKTFVIGNLMFNYIVVIAIVVMVFRFIRAFEKIAKSLDKGIVIRKDDNTTT